MKFANKIARYSQYLILISFLPLWSSAAANHDRVYPLGPIPQPIGQSRFEPADCPFEYEPQPGEIECGYLVVPENRDNPNGRSLRLAVAILKSRSADPEPDPVVFLTGGPGQGALGFEEYWLNSPILDERDFILLAPRGAGFSEPDMSCEEVPDPPALPTDRPPTAEEFLANELRWAQSCRDLLKGRGIDLSAYHTAALAADLEDLRIALEFERWNLYGVSYGTHWALTTMRMYPQEIRSVVLDSAVPLQEDHYAEHGALLDSAFNRLFEACNADPDCTALVPDMEATFNSWLARYDSNPVQLPPTSAGGEPTWLTGANIVEGLYNALFDPALIAVLPLAMDEINSGNLEIAAQLGEAVDPNFGISYGQFYSVLCHDEAPFYDREARAASLETYPLLRPFLARDLGPFVSPSICEFWEAGEAPMVENQPVVSDIPTLILSGQFDPVTPPSWGGEVARTLSNSYVYEFPGLTHGVTFNHDCPVAVMISFLNSPVSAPQTNCLQEMDPDVFQTEIYRNHGVFRLMNDLLLETNLVTAGLLAVIVVLLLAGVFVIPFRRWGATQGNRGWRLAHATGWLICLLCITFLGGLAWFIKTTLDTNQILLFFGLLEPAGWLFALPWPIAVLILGLLALLIANWRQGDRLGRILLAAIALSGIAFIGLLLGFGLWI